MNDFERFRDLRYRDYKIMAKDESLSKYQMIGFPDSYREGKEEYIFADIISKLGVDTDEKGLTFLDIGPGCTDLPHMLINFCNKHQNRLLVVDSEEMLNKLPNKDSLLKFPGYFPDDSSVLIDKFQNSIDYIICYSVLHVVFYQTCVYKFIDSAVSMLKPGGKLLIGDIPNLSKRRRFFSTDSGISFHQEFSKSNTLPVVNHYELEPSKIDDSIIFAILQRYRGFGFETYLLPQNRNLPMYNRREDVVICKT
jgi:hypothetical protein